MNSKKAKLEDVMYFLIEQTNRKAKLHSQQVFNQEGIEITVEQWVLLKIIHEHPMISQVELAEKATKEPASITRMLDVIQKKGFVERHPSPNDRRKYLLELSKAGEAMIEKNMELVLRLRAIGVDGFTAKELESLKSMLLRIQTNLS